MEYLKAQVSNAPYYTLIFYQFPVRLKIYIISLTNPKPAGGSEFSAERKSLLKYFFKERNMRIK